MRTRGLSVLPPRTVRTVDRPASGPDRPRDTFGLKQLQTKARGEFVGVSNKHQVVNLQCTFQGLRWCASRTQGFILVRGNVSL
jgi:hypothetical protein